MALAQQPICCFQQMLPHSDSRHCRDLGQFFTRMTLPVTVAWPPSVPVKSVALSADLRRRRVAWRQRRGILLAPPLPPGTPPNQPHLIRYRTHTPSTGRTRSGIDRHKAGVTRYWMTTWTK
jgi:hypothetical protein